MVRYVRLVRYIYNNIHINSANNKNQRFFNNQFVHITAIWIIPTTIQSLGELWWNFVVSIFGYGNLGVYHFTLIYSRLATILFNHCN